MTAIITHDHMQLTALNRYASAPNNMNLFDILPMEMQKIIIKEKKAADKVYLAQLVDACAGYKMEWHYRTNDIKQTFTVMYRKAGGCEVYSNPDEITVELISGKSDVGFNQLMTDELLHQLRVSFIYNSEDTKYVSWLDEYRNAERVAKTSNQPFRYPNNATTDLSHFANRMCFELTNRDMRPISIRMYEFNGIKYLELNQDPTVINFYSRSSVMYTLSLATGKPTQKSPSQKVLSQELVNDLRKYYGNNVPAPVRRQTQATGFSD